MPSKMISYCLCVLAGFLLINLRPNWKQLLLLSGLSLLIGVGSLLTKLLLAAYFWRRLIVLDSNGKKELLGQPLLFPARLSHARRFPEPERYNYWYDYLLVGIPVGLRGRIGTLLSIDNLPACETRREKCWFTIDPAYYLDPGSGDRSLEEKLRIFLERQGENPEEFPYAYLLSVPRFLWFQKSAINYWYLYNSERELAAIIMEINNSFYEKRNFFFRVTGDGLAVDEPEKKPQEVTAFSKGKGGHVSIQFLPSTPKRKHYNGSWEKLIFSSPFEPVKGYMTSKSVDVLAGPALQSNLTSNTDEGQMKITSRLSSWGNPIDPLSASGYAVARFVARWTHVGAMSAPRIVKEALRIRFRGSLKYRQRPEMRPGGHARKATIVERAIEPFFQEYLSQLAANCTFPLSIKYVPQNSLHFDPIFFNAPVSPTSIPAPTLTLEILSARFYTSFIEQSDPKSAFKVESTPCPTDSDTESRRLSVSDPDLLNKVLDTAGQTINAQIAKTEPLHPSHGIERAVLQRFISAVRHSPPLTFMDRFVEHNFSAAEQREYRASLLHYLLSRRLLIESQAIVELGFIAARATLVKVILQIVYFLAQTDPAIQCLQNLSITPTTGALTYAGWDMVHHYIGEYYLNPFGWGEGL